MGRILLAATIVALSTPLFAEPDRNELIRQVEASDALARAYETGPTTQPIARQPYDQVLRAAIDSVPANATEPDDLAALNDFQLRQLLSLLHQSNIERHMASANADAASSSAPATEHPATQPSRSAVFVRFINPPQIVVQQSALQGTAFSAQGEGESPDRQASPEESAIAVLAGASAQRAFGVPSGVAPLDARRPGSQQLAQRAKGTLPMPAHADRTSAMRAPPPGTPEALLPSPEEISRIAGTLGVSDAVAEEVATGRMTVADALTQETDGDGPVLRELLGGLAADDPRWKPLYFDPELASWDALQDEPFTFNPGGGQYVRSDQRVNQDFDLRTNGELDRRVNVNNDRRTTIQVDPRENH